MTSPDESRLLEGARRLDRAILAEIHDTFYPEVYRYAAYRLSDAQTAEDVSGEVFLRLIAALKTGKGPRQTLRGWLMGAASNLINDHYRAHYAAPQEELDENALSRSPGPAELAERNLQRSAVQAALRQLTEDQQHVLALRFGDGYSIEETAHTVRNSINAVKALQLRALAALRRHLESAGYD